MIEESLLKSSFLGKDGFIWWIGQVADPKVWRNEKTRIDNGTQAWGYRCKVRIIGYHSFSRNELPDENLPWAHVLTSASDGAPGQGGFGKLPLLVGGESVLGFFLDGEEAQQPVVMACFHRSPVVENVKNPQPFQAFPGSSGNLLKGPQLTRIKQQPPGTTGEIPKVTTAFGPAITFSQDANFGGTDVTSLDASPNFTTNTDDTKFRAGAAFKTPIIPTDRLFFDEKAELAFLKVVEAFGPVKGSNGCHTNYIGTIQETLQNFIRFVNGLESTALGFIDPVRNKIVNIQQDIKKVARLIASVMKSVINGMRDGIFKLIGCLFKLLGKSLPPSFQIPISEAAKNILNIIFCIFEKLFGPLWDFIEGLLDGLIGKTASIPRCAADETVAALIAKLIDMVDGALGSVMSGLDWLVDGIGEVASALTGGLSMIANLLSFLDCDALACKPVKSWDPFAGVQLPKTDDWAKAVNNINILGSLGDIDTAIGYLSMFGSGDTPFQDCRNQTVNPQTQDDISSLPLGTVLYKCIPPEVQINGDGIGASAKAVVSSNDGSILTIAVINPGKGFTTPPEIVIVDKSNYGKGAYAKSTINSSGNIESIYMVRGGSGYCITNLSDTVTGIGTTTTEGVGTGTTSVGISTVSSGIVTSIVIDSPGIGYTSGDTIEIGQCTYEPVLTTNGSIIGVTSPSSCQQTFLTLPDITINSTTGQGAVLYPVIQYVPQYIIDNPSLRSGISTDQIEKVVQCV